MLAGWDAYTILMLYWFETAVIGLWVCAAVAISPRDSLNLPVDNGQKTKAGVGLALFIAAHAGIFMFVHLMFLTGFQMVSMSSGPSGPDFGHLLFERGLWLPLAGLFLFRGLITLSDHAAGHPIEPTIVGFYIRIVVMQFVIILGGFFIALAGDALVPLLLLIGIRTAIDLRTEKLSEQVGVWLGRAAEAKKN